MLQMIVMTATISLDRVGCRLCVSLFSPEMQRDDDTRFLPGPDMDRGDGGFLHRVWDAQIT